MKKLIAYSILVAFTLLSACRKSENAKIPALARVPVPSLSKDASGAGTIVVSDLANFVGKVNVDLFFKSDVPPKKMDLVVTKNGDKTIVKVLKADITVFPSVVSFTGPQLISLFSSVQACDFFEVGVNITTADGTMYEAYPAVGIAYGAGVAAEYGGVQTTLTYSTKVEYDPNIYKGNFVVVSDGWRDTSPGDIIVFTQIDATHFSFLYPTAVNPLPIIVTVDPTTNTPSITKQIIGTAWVYDTDPPAPAARTLPGAANALAPCAKTISLNMMWSEAGTEYGPYLFKLVHE
ncbi:MAG: hypothetical protein ABIS01_17540 [Ferruginibacter sp.]